MFNEDPLVEEVANALYEWDKLLFGRMSDRYGAAKVAVDTLKKIAERMEMEGLFGNV